MTSLKQSDAEIAGAIDAERRRQAGTLEMIASENHCSAAVLDALGTVLTDKYAEGYPGRRYYCGNEQVDVIERLAIERGKALFGAEYANVQPHSGTTANLAVYHAMLKPGQKILAMNLSHGGHLSHGMPINLSGRIYQIAHYGVRKDTETLDMEEVRRHAVAERPDMIVVGASAYPRILDFAAFGAIAKEVGCLLMADTAHIAGLIVGGAHPSPLPHADFVTSTTHKTLRGPRGGVIFCRERFAKEIDAAVFPGLQGGPLVNAIAAKAVCFREAAQPSFRQYAAAVVANAKTLSEGLLARGWRLVSGGTDNHLMLVDLRSRDENLTGHVAADWLAAAGIVANWNKVPFDPRPPMQASGVRLGTPALTTRGMGAAEMTQIAEWFDRILLSGGDGAVLAKVRIGVAELCRRFPIPDRDNGQP
jgi:glycine hydroxymethyltransferase